MALPDTYSELYPNRFLHADQLKGGKVTLTIERMNIEVLEGEKGKSAKVIATFAKPQSPALAKMALDLVLPKTNGECLRRMFGNNPREWAGKRITLFPSKTECMGEIVDCIRIWGSPDIAEDLSITVPQGRKKALQMTMHKIEAKNGHAAAKATLDPRIVAAFGVLDWSVDEQAAYLAKNAGMTQAEMAADLNATIESRDFQEQ